MSISAKWKTPSRLSPLCSGFSTDKWFPLKSSRSLSSNQREQRHLVLRSGRPAYSKFGQWRGGRIQKVPLIYKLVAGPRSPSQSPSSSRCAEFHLSRPHEAQQTHGAHSLTDTVGHALVTHAGLELHTVVKSRVWEATKIRQGQRKREGKSSCVQWRPKLWRRCQWISGGSCTPWLTACTPWMTSQPACPPLCPFSPAQTWELTTTRWMWQQVRWYTSKKESKCLLLSVCRGSFLIWHKLWFMYMYEVEI